MASLRSASCHGNSSSHAAARTFAHTNNTNPLELLSQAALEDELSEASSSLSSSAAAVVAARNNHRRSLVPALERRHSLPTLLLSNSSNRRRKSSLHQSQGMDGMEEEAPLPEDAPFSSHHPADPNHQMVAMPADFVPGPYDVLCGRGRACKVAAGNLAYRDLIVTYLEVYGAADSKLQKGAILTDIMNRVRDLCHTYHQRQERHEKKKNAATGKNSTDTTSTTTTANSSPVLGGFVKCINGTWYEVGDFLAREKTSQCFRDALASHYSSSAQSKYLRRRARETTPNAPSATADGNSSSVSTSTNENPPGDSTSSYRQNDKGSLDDEMTVFSQQLSFRKRKRRPSEKAAVDVLQQLASMNQPPKVVPVAVSAAETMSPIVPLSPSSSSATLVSTAERQDSVVGVSSTPTEGHTKQPVSRLEPRAKPNSSVPLASHSSPQSQLPRATASYGHIRVCALQPALRLPNQSPWDAIGRMQRMIEAIAAEEQIDLFVLPELSPVGYSEDTFERFLPVNPINQAMYQEFDRYFQIIARSLNVYICYGTIGWSSDRRLLDESFSTHHIPKMFIRQIVVDRLGTQVACYDKTYLCDFGACAETRFFQPGPGSHPTSFVVHCRDRQSSFRFGLLICSDMRYPGLSRQLTASADHRVDCILQPSAFARDCAFRTWSSFQETRAVENSVYWIAVNYAGREFGESSVVPPFVDEANEPIKLGTEEGYVIGHISRSALDFVRRAMPFYRTLLKEDGRVFSEELERNRETTKTQDDAFFLHSKR